MEEQNRRLFYTLFFSLGAALACGIAIIFWMLFLIGSRGEVAQRPPIQKTVARPAPSPTLTQPVVQPTATTPTQLTAPAPEQPTATPELMAATPSPTSAEPSPATPTMPPLPPPKPLRMNSPEYGMQAFLWWRPETADRDLQLIKQAGFTWVKQIFAWRDIEGAAKGAFDWSRTDRIVAQANSYGVDILARIDHQPQWAGGGYPVNGPPDNYQDFGDFLYALASRYKGRIRAYEVWNEPNLQREWGGKPPNAAEYVALLKVAYRRIKEADPNAMVISAGLTPTGTQPPEAIPDDVYLEQMYQAGAKGHFDVLGAHGAGYKAPPEVSPDEAASNPAYGGERFFCFRRVEDLRAIMVRYGDADTQVAILEFGWTSDPVHPEYAWHAVSEEEKADYLVRAYKWAHEHWSPWIGVMSLIYIADPDWTEGDEQYWWSITTPDGMPREAYNRLKKARADGTLP